MIASAISIPRKATIALDADGVLLDYSTAYAHAWAKAFGTLPAMRDPGAYWPIDRWAVEQLHGEKLATFRAVFDDTFWSSIPAIAGAVEACHRLANAGYRLICISAISTTFAAARQQNLRSLNFPISEVIATDSKDGTTSPKAAAVAQLQPIAFVDDYLPYHRGISPSVHKALILREPIGSPNIGDELSSIDSFHSNLSDFAEWWLQ